jgi:hypothetical protein
LVLQKIIIFYKNFMLYQFGFYSSVLLISFTQGIVYSALLAKAIKTDNKSNYWLSFFIFFVASILHLGCLVLGWYQPYRDILFYTPFQHLMDRSHHLFYTKFTESLFQIFEKEALHLTPGLLYLLHYCYLDL